MRKRVVLFGCQQISVDFLRHLQGLSDVEVILVVTKELPMDVSYGYQSVIREATGLGISVITPKKVTSDIVADIKALKPDIIFSVYYREIFPRELLSIPPLGCVNIHPGLLPCYRGPVPTAWAIKRGETTYGITIHYMDEGIDTGDILVQQEFPIEDDETGYELYTKAMREGFLMLKANLEAILSGSLNAIKQRGVGSYYGKGHAKFMINWQQNAADIRNMIRAHAKPYNMAETTLFNKYLFVNKATIIQDEKYPAQGPGKIVDILENDRLVISCADGCLLLNEYEVFPAVTEAEREIYFQKGVRLGK